MGGTGRGFIFEMIARLKANRAMLKGKHYFEIKDIYLKASKGKKISFRECPPEILEKIRKDFKKEAKTRKYKTIVALVFSGVVTALFLWIAQWVVLYYFF